MKCYSAVLVAVVLIAVFMNSIQCRHIPDNPLILTPGITNNQTNSERLTALTDCLEETGYPKETVEGLQNLFAEFEGQTDVMYLIRAAEFIGDDYMRGKNCVCSGIYSSSDRGQAKHCFNRLDEWAIILDLCLAKTSSSAAKYLPKVCGVGSLKELRNCCKHPSGSFRPRYL